MNLITLAVTGLCTVAPLARVVCVEIADDEMLTIRALRDLLLNQLDCLIIAHLVVVYVMDE
jgi:hypothetical protein